eukprot:TRINITY_DN1392_c0_g1_i1.p1 TRINITY_DN1392_c0_g1~~TRINITY_DN1392_c0_g1_i1.p1  ORF type:complete len:488 (-),score=224.68 TRINITY_DN1392_c0_g1_i1:75-1481(-)
MDSEVASSESESANDGNPGSEGVVGTEPPVSTPTSEPSSSSSSSSASAPAPADALARGDSVPEIVVPAAPLVDEEVDESMPDGLESFEKVKLIGRGDVGRVYLVRHKPTGLPYAMKVMSKREMIARNKIQRALTEREILATTHHPFIVTMSHCFQNQEFLFFVMDYCAGGEFFRALQKQPNKCLPEAHAKFYGAEVLLGLEYLHLMGFIYRDLKPENILLHESGHIRLTDFNLSKQAKTPVFARMIRGHFGDEDILEVKPELLTNSFVGTEEYIAPEVISGEGHGSSVDWWTFGILLYEMIYGTTPFKGRTQEETFAQILKCGIKFPDKPMVTRDCKDLIKKLINPDPKRRLGAEHGAADIRNHPWFSDIKWALLLNQDPPLRLPIDTPFDTRNFRCFVDDQKVILAGREMKDEDIAKSDPFSSFTRYTAESPKKTKSSASLKLSSSGLPLSSSTSGSSSSSSADPHH